MLKKDNLKKTATTKGVKGRLIDGANNNPIEQFKGALEELQAANLKAREFLDRTYRELIEIELASSKANIKKNIAILQAVKKNSA